ncbi:HPr family phosphocarrier protein [Desulfobacula phenolica]|uniref:Phosphocarrier protein n=1 Tax=Desulfobacula phenolica TaxID=90732 RepID=A0A1H2DPS0_9BACT|nr:HPr family phosphocarrier protein [Desulfobacula phenolica]SDT84774.1 phosphocarrier protein [Desulfobacula phenolica]
MKNSGIITRKTLVKNELGMHARPASKIAQMAEMAQSEVWLCANSTKVDATSIIDILTLCAVKGTRIVIEIENQEDMVILDRIVDFFETGFGEI